MSIYTYSPNILSNQNAKSINEVFEFVHQEDGDTIKFEKPSKVKIIELPDQEATSNYTFDTQKTIKKGFTKEIIQIQLHNQNLFKHLDFYSKNKCSNTQKVETTKSSDSLRKKFGHLLPPYLSCKLSQSHLSLISLSAKIDAILLDQYFLNDNQWVSTSLLFCKLKELNFKMVSSQIKRLNYLNCNLYSYKMQGQTFYMQIKDIRNYDGHARRIGLRRSIYSYVKAQQAEYIKKNNIMGLNKEEEWIQEFDYELEIPQNMFLDSYDLNVLEFDSVFVQENCHEVIQKQVAPKKLDSFRNKLLQKMKSNKYKAQNSTITNGITQNTIIQNSSKYPNWGYTTSDFREDKCEMIDVIKEMSQKYGVSNFFQNTLIQRLSKLTKSTWESVESEMNNLVSKKLLTVKVINNQRIISICKPI